MLNPACSNKPPQGKEQTLTVLKIPSCLTLFCRGRNNDMAMLFKNSNSVTITPFLKISPIYTGGCKLGINRKPKFLNRKYSRSKSYRAIKI